MPTEDEILDSAVAIVATVIALPVLDDHKRGVINGMLWAITQARGKYATRFRSVGALNAPKGTKLQHEHVVPRKELVSAILREPERVRELLATAVGCVVTADEHRRLTEVTRKNPQLAAWERYKVAGVEVVDTDAVRA